MARVPYPDPAELSEETRAFLAKMKPLNIFRMIGYGEKQAVAGLRFGNAILMKGELDPVLREIAILRVGHLCRASYEVHQHEIIGRGLGMSDELLQAIKREPDDAVFDDAQKLVMRFTDEVVNDVKASDATFQAVAEKFGYKQTMELVLAISFYMLISRVLENFEVEIEDDTHDILGLGQTP
jgi:alkylhydroperoxidase family enzyme